MNCHNNKASVSFYKKNGYVVLKDVICSDEIQTVISEVHQLFIEQLNYLGVGYVNEQNDNALLKNMERLFSYDLERYKATLRQVNKLVSVHKVLTSNTIISFVKALGLKVLSFPTDPVFHCMSEQLRIPGGYMTLSAHQDWSSLQNSLDSLIVWSPLTNITSCNDFPIEIIPGSHKEGLLPGGVENHVYKIEEQYFDEGQFIPILLSKTDVVLFSSFTIHRTGKGRDDNLRIACSLRYENVFEPTYIERAYPNIYKRILERDIKTKGFPEKQHVAHLFKESAEA